MLGLTGALIVAIAQPGDGGLELFFDGQGIAELTGDARRELHAPIPREVVFAFDAPWEGPDSTYATILERPEGGYLLYYRGLKDEKAPQYTCVAESTDGIHFTRTTLGLIEHEGSTANNILLTGADAHNFAPFLDTRPGCPAEERYKALAGGPLHAYASVDGFHWRLLQEEPVITDGAFDSQNTAHYDTVRGCYTCYYRDFRNGVRTIRRARSADFLHWSGGEWLDFPGSADEHLYTNAIVPYFRNPRVLVGFPKRFLPDRRKDPNHPFPGLSDGLFMSSRDGLTWERWPEAFLRPGPDPENWTDRNMMVLSGIVPLTEGEISVYWVEHYEHATARIRRGTVRTDGFVSVHAGAAGGELRTRPVLVTGGKLRVNYATSAAGSIRFELLDEAGLVLEGYSLGDSEELFGDEIAHEVSWRGSTNLAALVGRTVSLRADLRDADLYSYEFAD